MNNIEKTVESEKKESSSTQPLFRAQAIEYHTIRQYGTIVLTRPWSQTYVTCFFLLITILIIVFFATFETTRKAQSRGVLLPTAGIIRVITSQSGVIKERSVKEGQNINKGDVLFVLTSERSGIKNNSAEKTVSTLLEGRRDSYNIELAQSKVQTQQRLSALAKRARDLSGEIERNSDQIALQIKRAAISEETFQRFSALQATNYISAAQLQEKQADVIDQHQRIADLTRIKSANERELSNARADSRDLQLQSNRDFGALQRNVSTIEQDLTENEARREIIIRAPKSGVLTTITAEVGQTVTANSSLAAILPAGAQLEAEVYAPSRSAGFIKPGMTVLLRYQAYPHEKFGQYKSIVSEVANTSLRPEELALPGVALPPNAPSEPLYRVRLKLEKQDVLAYGKPIPLKSGMLVEASFMLEHRRLYEWILEPLFSISGRL